MNEEGCILKCTFIFNSINCFAKAVIETHNILSDPEVVHMDLCFNKKK